MTLTAGVCRVRPVTHPGKSKEESAMFSSRRWQFCSAVLAFLAAAASAAQPAYKTKNAIIVSMDGVRFSETFGDPKRERIPSLA